MSDYLSPQPPTVSSFRWRPAIVGGMAAIGISALLGTLVTNASLWLSLVRGLTLQEAYAAMGVGLSSPTELLSLAVVLLSGFSGGYVSASYGNGRHLTKPWSPAA